MNKVLAVDHNNLIFRAMFTRKGLTHNGKFTGGVFGYLSMISNAIDSTGCNRLLICKDHKPYLREKRIAEKGAVAKKGDKGYKGDRKKLDKKDLQNLKDTYELTSALLKILKPTVLDRKGYEADDMIANFVYQHWEKYSAIIMMSNDKDLYQIFRKDNFFLLTSKGLYGRREFKKEYKIEPKLWHKVQALSGGHNGVGGITGVGDKTAIKLLSDKTMDEIKEQYGKPAKHMNFFSNIAKLPIKELEVPTARKCKVNIGELSDFLKSLKIKTNPQLFYNISKLGSIENKSSLFHKEI